MSTVPSARSRSVWAAKPGPQTRHNAVHARSPDATNRSAAAALDLRSGFGFSRPQRRVPWQLLRAVDPAAVARRGDVKALAACVDDVAGVSVYGDGASDRHAQDAARHRDAAWC